MATVDPYDGEFGTVPCPKCGAAPEAIELNWISIHGNDKWSYPSANCGKCGWEVEMPFVRDRSDAFCRFLIVTAWNRYAAEMGRLGRSLTHAEALDLILDVSAMEKEFNG